MWDRVLSLCGGEERREEVTGTLVHSSHASLSVSATVLSGHWQGDWGTERLSSWLGVSVPLPPSPKTSEKHLTPPFLFSEMEGG